MLLLRHVSQNTLSNVAIASTSCYDFKQSDLALRPEPGDREAILVLVRLH